MNKIEELENKMLEIAQEIAELKKGQNAGEWKPSKYERYYFMNSIGIVDNDSYDPNCESDVWRVENIPVFETREECQKYIDYRKALIGQSYKFSREEWNDENINKHFIFYGCRTGNWIVDFSPNKQLLCGPYFKTFDDAQFMIDNYGEEMLKWGLL